MIRFSYQLSDVCIFCCLLFFKQKTAYELRISDWSSDVCSSDLAFAIVGYTREGFVIQNSWGDHWGRGGFAVLPYADWLDNAMDCWVVQLGVVTAEHDAVSHATSLRVDAKTGRAVISSDPTLGDHEISPFVVALENEGRLSERGRFRTDREDRKSTRMNSRH